MLSLGVIAAQYLYFQILSSWLLRCLVSEKWLYRCRQWWADECRISTLHLHGVKIALKILLPCQSFWPVKICDNNFLILGEGDLTCLGSLFWDNKSLVLSKWWRCMDHCVNLVILKEHLTRISCSLSNVSFNSYICTYYLSHLHTNPSSCPITANNCITAKCVSHYYLI